MSRHPQLYPWTHELATRLPLSPALAGVLALWSLGMVLARRCGLDTVTTHVACLLNQSFHTVRQRLREFYQEAPAKRGTNRKDFQTDTCFAPLLRWVLSFWSDKRLALAVDVTNLGDRFHVLCLSALYGGIGIPVAWKILVGNQPDAWHPYWCALLRRVKDAVPADWQVVVLSDRGLESPRLFREITKLGWHPLMRVKRNAKFQPDGWHGWYWLSTFAARPGSRFAMAGRVYRNAPLGCTLLALWDEGHREPWLLVSDLPPCAAHPCWYAWRAWIEQGFKVAKSGGLDWQNTRMTQAERAERQFLAIAVTTLWLVAVGTEVEHEALPQTIDSLPKGEGRADEVQGGDQGRRIRLFVWGKAAVLAALINHAPLPRGKLLQKSWPKALHTQTISERDFLKASDLQL